MSQAPPFIGERTDKGYKHLVGNSSTKAFKIAAFLEPHGKDE